MFFTLFRTLEVEQVFSVEDACIIAFVEKLFIAGFELKHIPTYQRDSNVSSVSKNALMISTTSQDTGAGTWCGKLPLWERSHMQALVSLADFSMFVQSL